MSRNITIIGSLNTDLITRTSRIPAAGETLISSSYSTGCGGKGANQAVACARLSRSEDSLLTEARCTVSMTGAVGDDMFGRDLINGLRGDGVNVLGISRKAHEKSGVAVIIVDEESGENRILMSPNANFALMPSDFQSLPDPLPDVILLQLELRLETVLQVLRLAQERKVEVVLNPAPAVELPPEAYGGVTHLIVNESEASIVTGTVGQSLDWSRWGDHTERLVALGVRHITVTLGSQGAMYIDAEKEKVRLFPGEKVKVVDTTAAGDTFVGAYAVALGELDKSDRDFYSMSRAVELANKAAAKTVQKEGAQSAIPWRNEVASVTTGGYEASLSFGEWKQGRSVVCS